MTVSIGDVICEVMLQAYKSLEAICTDIEEQSRRVALCSINKTVYKSVERLAELNKEITAYSNVRYIIEQALSKAGDTKELRRYYIQGETLAAIALSDGLDNQAIKGKIVRQRRRLFKEIKRAYRDDELLNIIVDSKALMSMYAKGHKRAVEAKTLKDRYKPEKRNKTGREGK